jgi:hypothetical protein
VSIPVLLLLHIDITAVVVAAAILSCTGQRCQFSFETISFQIKWIVQLVSHMVFSGLFVWPLIKHMRLMGSPENVMETGGSRGNSVYHRLVNRAMWAMAVSTLFTGT